MVFLDANELLSGCEVIFNKIESVAVCTKKAAIAHST